jgi:hypothetical protein
MASTAATISDPPGTPEATPVAQPVPVLEHHSGRPLPPSAGRPGKHCLLHAENPGHLLRDKVVEARRRPPVNKLLHHPGLARRRLACGQPLRGGPAPGPCRLHQLPRAEQPFRAARPPFQHRSRTATADQQVRALVPATSQAAPQLPAAAQLGIDRTKHHADAHPVIVTRAPAQTASQAMGMSKVANRDMQIALFGAA